MRCTNLTVQPSSKQRPHVLLFFYQTFDNSSASLPPFASLVNSSYDAANASLSEIQQTHDDSEQLLQDVVEAEGKISSKFYVARAPARFSFPCLSFNVCPVILT